VAWDDWLCPRCRRVATFLAVKHSGEPVLSKLTRSV
jgi:hypothetical protein